MSRRFSRVYCIWVKIPTFDCFPLKIVNTNFDFDQDHSSISYLIIFNLMRLKTSRLILQILYILLHLIKFQIDTSHSSYLLYSMISLKNYYKYLPRFDGGYGNITTKNTFRILKIFSTFLRLKKMMSVLGFFLYLCKAKPRNGSKHCQLQSFLISISLWKSSLINGWSRGILLWF